MYMFAHLTIETLHYVALDDRSGSKSKVHISCDTFGVLCGTHTPMIQIKGRLIDSDRVCKRCAAILRDSYPTNNTYPRARQQRLAMMVTSRLANSLADMCEANGWKVESAEHVMGTDRTQFWISDGISKTMVEF